MKQISFVLCCVFILAVFPAMAEEKQGQVESSGAEQVLVFDVTEYRVEGNTVLPVIKIEKVLYPHLGTAKKIEDVEKARADLEKAYRDAGYPTVLVDIPEQDVNNRMVRLRVTEGKVEKVRVVGSRYYSQGHILEKFPALTQGGVLYLPDVQKGLGQVNRNADRRVTPILRPGKTPGTVEVDFKVEDKLPLHASLELNNRYSGNTSPLRLTGMVRYDNLWQREHSLSLQYQTAPENTSEVSVLSASYLLPVPDSDKLIAMYAVRSRSNVAAVGNISVLGQGDIYGVRAILPLPQRDRYFHSLSLGFDYKDFKENVTLLGADSIRTPISYLPFSVQYNATIQGDRGVTQADVGLNFALRGLADKRIDCFGQDVSQFECKRHNAKANYLYLKAGLQRAQKLPLGMTLVARIDGQLADQPLISNEQFGAGGVDSVRGYLMFERLADNGMRGSLELRSRSFAKALSARVDDFYVLGFLEGAKLRVSQPLPGQLSRFDLSSAGVGARFRGWRHLNMAVDAAVPFTSTAYTTAGDVRFHFRLAYEF
ncbi:MAG: ShlB/FhaC/HecB family hemolysin secretion/activation protein [Gammaproteobacteria bacterium]